MMVEDGEIELNLMAVALKDAPFLETTCASGFFTAMDECK